jgi:hypothetical protein
VKERILLCFGERLGESAAFQAFADDMRDSGLQVHLFDGAAVKRFRPHDVLSVMEQNWGEDLDRRDYYFLSNIEGFFELCYKALPQTFRGFIRWSDGAGGPVCDADMEPVYEALLSLPLPEEGAAFPEIFVNDMDMVFSEEALNLRKTSLAAFPGEDRPDDAGNRRIIYRLAGQGYLIEPGWGETCYVALDEEKTVSDDSFADVITPFDLDRKLLKQTQDVLDMIARQPEKIMRRQTIPHKLFSQVKTVVLAAARIEQKYYTSLISAMAEAHGALSSIYALSFFLQIYRTYDVYRRLAAVCLDSQEISGQNRYFILAQNRHVELTDRAETADRVLSLDIDLLKKSAELLEPVMEDNLAKLAGQELDKDAIVLLSGQILSYSHKETAHMLDLAKYLIEKQRKKVYVINTCEYLPQIGAVPYFDVSAAYVNNEYSKGNSIEHEGTVIPFCQMISAVPALGGIDGITEFIEDVKPGLIISVAEMSVMAQLTAPRLPTVYWPPEDCVPVCAGGRLLLSAQVSEAELAVYGRNAVTVLPLPASDDGEDREKFYEKAWAKIAGDF